MAEKGGRRGGISHAAEVIIRANVRVRVRVEVGCLLRAAVGCAAWIEVQKPPLLLKKKHKKVSGIKFSLRVFHAMVHARLIG